MLIDAGNVGQDTLILDYLAEYEITSLDYLVATHPHADHIGSMAAVIQAMDSVGTLIMPDVIHTTNIFEKLLDAIEEKDINIKNPQSGETFEMGNARIQVLAPNSNDYAELNNYSVVLRMEYGETVFLFVGDAEDISEAEQLAANYTLNADVIKIGHHGSKSSTTQQYINSISPTYAIISCGKGNSYGHPHSETISKLMGIGAELYRTDENGTVIFVTDGETITVRTEKKAVSDNENNTLPTETILYIGNKNSFIFHLPTCGSLPAEKNRVFFSSRTDAINEQYRPCKLCKP